MIRRLPHLILLSLVVFGMSACAGLADGPLRSGSAGEPLFIPPTLVVTVTPAVLPSPTFSPPTPTPPCSNGLSFLEDLTIPDGAQVEAGSTLDKQWLVQNNGTCNWNETYRLKLIEGPELGAQVEQSLFPARSGAQATLQILFQAPADPGVYTSAWQAVDPAGNPFGDPVYIQIVVP